MSEGSDRKTPFTTRQSRKFDLLVVIDYGFPVGAVSMHVPAVGAHAVGKDEAEAHERLLENIRRRERGNDEHRD